MIPIVSEGSIDIGKCQLGKLRNDVIRGPSALIVPKHNVHYTNSMAGDSGLPAAYSGSEFNMFFYHDSQDSHLLKFYLA
jgi:hypothetical protein